MNPYGGADGYLAHRRSEETAYLVAFEEFEKTLTDEQRAVLGDAAAPDLDEQARAPVGLTKDAAETSRASAPAFDVAEALDDAADELRERWNLSAKTAAGIAAFIEERVEAKAREIQGVLIVRTIGPLMDSNNVKLSAAGLAYASGLAAATGMPSMRQWAALNHVTAAAVSKASRWWLTQLDLPEGPTCRPAEVSEILSHAQKKKHWRYRNREDEQEPEANNERLAI